MIYNPFEVREYVLQRLSVMFQTELPVSEYHSMDMIAENRLRSVVLAIKRDFFGERIHEKVEVPCTFRVPATAWQLFKRDYFPKWLLKWRPVRYAQIKSIETVTFDRQFCFPNAYLPESEMLGRFYVLDTDDRHFSDSSRTRGLRIQKPILQYDSGQVNLGRLNQFADNIGRNMHLKNVPDFQAVILGINTEFLMVLTSRGDFHVSDCLIGENNWKLSRIEKIKLRWLRWRVSRYLKKHHNPTE